MLTTLRIGRTRGFGFALATATAFLGCNSELAAIAPDGAADSSDDASSDAPPSAPCHLTLSQFLGGDGGPISSYDSAKAALSMRSCPVVASSCAGYQMLTLLGGVDYSETYVYDASGNLVAVLGDIAGETYCEVGPPGFAVPNCSLPCCYSDACSYDTGVD
jgi:hypothetical protein